MSSPFTIGHFAGWAPRLILDSGAAWSPEPFQLEFLEDVFSGAPECWLIVPEGNGKTTLVAALALYGLRFSKDALIPVAASSRDQARIMYRQAKGFLRRSKLDENGLWFEGFDGYRRIDLRGSGRTKRGEVLGSIEIHAADAGTGDGVIPAPYAVLDELHRHKDLELYETWRGKLIKRGAQLIAISTAGEPGTPFEETRDRIRNEAAVVRREATSVRAMSDQVALHEWAVPEGGDINDLELVACANPLLAVTVEMLAKKRSSPTMTDAHWSRFTCNLPTRSVQSAITEAEWDEARVDDEIPIGERIDVGLDLGWKKDTTAFVPLWMPRWDYRLLGAPTILIPPRDGKMQDPHLMERSLLGIHERNPIDTVVMDMTDGAQLAKWIEEELGATVVDRTQSVPLQVVDFARFMEALREGWLHHTGDPGLRRHVLNAIAQTMPRGDVAFRRPAEGQARSMQGRRVVDALIAAAMVHTYRAAEFQAPRPPRPMVAFA